MNVTSKLDIIAELVASAVEVDITNERHMEKFRAYLDLYADERARLADPVPPPSIIEGKRAKHEVKTKAPEPSSVSVEATVAPDAAEETPPAPEPVSKKSTRSQFSGQGGSEKKAIYTRLREYRVQGGPGCYERLEKASGGAVTTDELREMFNATPFPIEKWRAVGAALDALKGKPA